MTSPTADARRSVQGPSRRAVARGAAWTLPVVAIASAAPSASASGDKCTTCSPSRLAYKGANFANLDHEVRGTAWYAHNHADEHHVYIDINIQVGDTCVTATPTPPGYAYTATIGDTGAGFPVTNPTLSASLSNITIHTTAAAMVSGSPSSFPADPATAAIGGNWGNGEHLSLHTVDTYDYTNHKATTNHIDAGAVAYVTATLTIGACSYLITMTPGATQYGPLSSVSFAP